MGCKLVKLSQTVSHALRHQPDDYGLILDEGGWVLIDNLLAAIIKIAKASTGQTHPP